VKDLEMEIFDIHEQRELDEYCNDEE